MPDGLRGVKAPAPKDRQVSTEAADLRFEHQAGTHGAVPGVVATKRVHTDPVPGGIQLTTSELAAIDSVDKLEETARRLLAAHASYLEARDVSGANATVGTAGLRKPALFAGLIAGLAGTGIPAADQVRARRLLERLERESFLGRAHELTVGHLDSYHPYSDPFDDGVRALRDLAPAGRARDSIEAVLNYIIDQKTTKAGSSLDERNAEKTLGLRVVDRNNGGQSVSLKAGPADPRHPEYVVLNLAAQGLPEVVPVYVTTRLQDADALEAHLNARLVDPANGRPVSLARVIETSTYATLSVGSEGLPPELAEYAGRGVYRDGDALVFDGTHTPVPAALAEHLVEQPVAGALALRPLREGEVARERFPIGSAQVEGLPADFQRHAGRAVLRDGDRFFFDGTSDEVPAALARLVVERPVEGKLGSRALGVGERPRHGFWADVDHSGAIDANERDAERDGRRLIDAATGQAVSLARQQPALRLADLAGKPVYRAGETLYLDGSGDELPKALHAHLVEKRASRNLGLRLVAPGERLRDKLPYDWNKDGEIDLDRIETSWWGHCHIKAALGALDLHAGSQVRIFDAQSGVEKTFTDTDINDLLFALFDADDYSSWGVERTRFVGNRNDSTGNPVPADQLVIETGGGGAQSFAVRIRELRDAAGNRVDSEQPFLPTRLESGSSLRFVDNPEFRGLTERDWSSIVSQGTSVLEVSTYDVSAEGEIVRRSASVNLDPAQPQDEPVLIAAQLGGGYPPRLERTYLNLREQRLERRAFVPTKVEVEADLERALGLRVIDPENGDRTVSVAAGASADKPAYVLLEVGSAVPPQHAALAGRPVLRDAAGTLLFDDGSGAPVPPELSAALVERPASEKLGVRPLGEREVARAAFAFDLDRNEEIGAGLREDDVERELRLRPIDRRNGGQAVSLAAGSTVDAPRYVLLNVAREGLPAELGEHADRALIRDASGALYFDGTGTRAPRELAAHLVERPASAELGVRRLAQGEEPRWGFPVDLNRNQVVGRGVYELVPEGPAQVIGQLSGLSLRRELTMESTLEIHNELMRAIREGISFVADTSSDHAVWNYGVTGVKVTEVAREGNFVKYAAEMTGARKNWEYIIEEDDDGRPVRAHPLSPPPDFLWQPERSVALPAFKDPDSGSLAVNEAATRRGYVRLTGGRLDKDSLAFYRYAADIIYASLADPKERERYVIRDANGDLYFYADQAVFAEDVAGLRPREP